MENYENQQAGHTDDPRIIADVEQYMQYMLIKTREAYSFSGKLSMEVGQ